MAVDYDSNPILKELGVVLALAAALHLVLGPIIASVIDALKPTKLVPINYAGLVAIGLSGFLGLLGGTLASTSPDVTGEKWRYVAYGFLAGLLGPGAGAIRSAQARTGMEFDSNLRKYEAQLMKEQITVVTLDNNPNVADDDEPNDTKPEELRALEYADRELAKGRMDVDLDQIVDDPDAGSHRPAHAGIPTE